VTMDLKGRTHRVAMIAARRPTVLANLAATHRAVAGIIREGKVAAVHDISDGGLAVAAAEMCIASGLGMVVGAELFMNERAFAEAPGRYLVELADQTSSDDLRRALGDSADVTDVGLVQHLRKFTVTTEKERVLEVGLEEMTAA
jgi:phosphoribosylformylglycinamidine (FGAM) synthase-like enzyme